MNKRITVVIDNDLIRKLREIQAREIKKSAKSISFSKIINEVLKKSV